MNIKKKERVVVEYADTLGELQAKGIKWNHDHAWFHFFGQTKNVPEDQREFITTLSFFFIFITFFFPFYVL
jgi:hypothetical protein